MADRERKTRPPTQAMLQRVIRAACAEAPSAVVEFEIDGVVYRVKRADEQPAATPFDNWKAKRDARQTQGH